MHEPTADRAAPPEPAPTEPADQPVAGGADDAEPVQGEGEPDSH